MWKKIFAVVLVVIVLAVIGIGAYFIFRPSAHLPNIELDRHYYINQLRNGHYRYPTATGITEGQPLVTLEDQDSSYCVFEDNFKIFRIHFTSGAGTVFDFVATNVKHGKGKLTATVRQVYNGEIHTYSISTTKDKIVLKTTISYQVRVASEEYSPSPVITVNRPDVIVMAFMRVTPSYINEVAP